MAVKQSIYGQTNYDIALEVYGNLDLLTKLAIDNNINDLSVVVNIYNYDSSNKSIISNYIGYSYSTSYDNNQVNICSIPTGLSIISFTENSILFRFNNDFDINFQYAYNATGDSPLDSDWINTNSFIVLLSNLSSSTVYYIFVRKQCNSILYSGFIKISQETAIDSNIYIITESTDNYINTENSNRLIKE